MAKNLLNTIAASIDSNQAAPAVVVKKKRAPRAKKEVVIVEHAMTIESALPSSGDQDLEALLAELGIGPEEVIEPTYEDEKPLVIEASLPLAEEHHAAALEAAVNDAETADLMSAAASEEGEDGSAPTGDSSELKPKVKAESASVVKEKKVVTPRVRYTDKVERLKARVGDQLAEYSVLTTADVADAGTEEELNAVMARTMDIVSAMNKKVGNRGVNFIEWLSGKKASLNNVIERSLRLLDADDYLQTGDQGNVMKNLLARPYSPASARAMGGNTVVMLSQLKVIIPLEGHKGRFVPNPDSLLLAKARSMLSGSVEAAVSEGEAAEEAPEDAVVVPTKAKESPKVAAAVVHAITEEEEALF